MRIGDEDDKPLEINFIEVSINAEEGKEQYGRKITMEQVHQVSSSANKINHSSSDDILSRSAESPEAKSSA